MIFYITVLRAIAACLITNAHYTGVYPTDLIANGGLLGDVIFFAVSGYCLTNIKLSPLRWYAKRVIRVYLPLLLVTAVYVHLGFYVIYGEHSYIWWFIYPTNYHFATSIVILYIPYYLVMKVDYLKKHLPMVMGAVLLVYILIYIFAYDKSYYHIDDVWEAMIRFMFFECMLLGAYFRCNEQTNKTSNALPYIISTFILLILYFASKLIFVKIAAVSVLQILNQFVLFALLYSIFRLFIALADRLDSMPTTLKKLITFISDITLEIYLVQYVLIDHLCDRAVFPINWLLITVSIIIAAYIVHIITHYLVDKLSQLITV